MSDINFRKLLRKAMESEWAVACRKKKNGEILNSGKQHFFLVKNTLRYWCADPFPVEEGGKTYLFFEAFDRIKRKGVIGYREMISNKAGRIQIIIEEPFHLSYPYIYCENGRWYLIPESKESNQIIRYQAIRFPDLWEQEKVLIDNISAVDSTEFSHDSSCMKLFTYLFERFNKGELQIIQLEDRAQSILYKFEDLDGRKRPAGKIVRIGDGYYRPSQLCTRTYGEAIILNKVLSSADSSYEETEEKIVTIRDISLDRPVKIAGVHTYNSSENWEVIDVEMVGFSILRLLGLIPRIYHRIRKVI